MTRALMVVSLLLLFAPAASADKRREVVVVSPYAVSVAVPVASYAPYAYSSSCAQQAAYMGPPRSAEDILAEHLAAKISARLGMPLQAQPKSFAEKPTLFAQNCATCHAKGNPDLGKPQFTTLDALTETQRLKAIDEIVNDRMPKGKKLTPQEAAGHIRELVSVKPKAVADESPTVDDRPPPPIEGPPPAPQP